MYEDSNGRSDKDEVSEFPGICTTGTVNREKRCTSYTMNTTNANSQTFETGRFMKVPPIAPGFPNAC
jgi:hypothetical protein